jgi:two-component system, NtrC family, response regulator PilR
MDRLKALVIDDEETVCESITAILETEGIETYSTTSSLQALDLITKNTYDIIISDVIMPEIDGFKLYDYVKEIAPDSIFILITAFGTVSSAIEAIERGIYDYIPKPFTPNEVRILVKKALEKKRLEQL